MWKIIPSFSWIGLRVRRKEEKNIIIAEFSESNGMWSKFSESPFGHDSLTKHANGGHC